MILSNKRIAKALIKLHRCAGWSAPLLFASFLSSRPIYTQNPYISPGTWCCPIGGIAADSESSNTPKLSLFCPTDVVHVLLQVEVTSHVDLGSISFMCFR